MVPPGFVIFIAVCLVISNPTVSKTTSNEFSFKILSFGLTVLEERFLEQTSNLF